MIKKIIPFLLIAITLFAQQSSLDQNQFMLAEGYEQKGDLDKAVEIVEALNKKDPSNIQYFNKLNSIYLLLKKYDKSVALINNRRLLTPQDITLYGMLGSTYYTAGDINKAFSIWDNAIEKFQNSPVAFRVISNYVIEKRDFEKAIEILNRGKKVSEDPYLFSYDLAELYNITMRYHEAAEEYCTIIKSNPSQYSQIENKILSYSSKPSALNKTIDVVKKYQSDNIAFKYLLAKLYIERKDYEDAFNLYKQIDKEQNSRGIELYSFAENIFREGEFPTALQVYQYIIDSYPDQDKIQLAKLGYAKTQEALLMEKYAKENPDWKPYGEPIKMTENEIEPVQKAYEELIQLDKYSEVATEANLRIGVLMFRLLGNITEAQKHLKIITENFPTSKFASMAFIELGNIALQQSDLKEAESNFQSVEKLPRTNSEDKSYAKYQLSRIYSFKSDFESARKILQTVLSNLKDNIANDAIEFSILLNTAKNDSSNLMLYCNAEFLSEQYKFSEAQKMYEQLANNQQAFIFHSIAKLRSAEMILANNDYGAAIKELGSIVNEGEKNIYADKALYLQGQIYNYGLKNDLKAIESYESLLARFPKSLYLDEARQKIIELKNKLS